MTHKLRLLASAHEVVGQIGLFRHADSDVVKLTAHQPRPHNDLGRRHNIPRRAVRTVGFFAEPSHGEDTRHVRRIGRVIARHIDHDGRPVRQLRAVSPYGTYRRLSRAAESEVER